MNGILRLACPTLGVALVPVSVSVSVLNLVLKTLRLSFSTADVGKIAQGVAHLGKAPPA